MAACLAVLYIFVKAFLSRETFFRFNRMVLLAGISACLVLPLIRINIAKISPLQTPFIQIEEVLSHSSPHSSPHSPIDKVFLAEQETLVDSQVSISVYQPLIMDENTTIDWIMILIIAYITGFAINLGLLLRSVFSMLKIITNGQKIHYNNYILVIVDDDICPFSWKKYIVLARADYEDNPNEIITHELAHIRHRHSLDILFIETVLLFQWFNPAVWLLKRDLEDIHEYQADISVLQSGIDATKYQLLLVKKAVGTSSYTIANSFNHSKIKKRITMMLKIKSNKWTRLKLLLALPLVAITMYSFAHPAINQLPDTGMNKGMEILPETKDSQDELEVKQDKPVKKSDENLDKRKIVRMSKMGNDGKLEYSLPVSYDISLKNIDRIKTYIVDSKSYTFEEFQAKFTGYYGVYDEKDLPENRVNVIEFYCKTLSGLTTPMWYLVKKTEIMGNNENGQSTGKTYEEFYQENMMKITEKKTGRMN